MILMRPFSILFLVNAPSVTLTSEHLDHLIASSVSRGVQEGVSRALSIVGSRDSLDILSDKASAALTSLGTGNIGNYFPRDEQEYENPDELHVGDDKFFN